jgi:hypothetical protein
MDTDRVDFISAYCDRWCERCAFTDRCSAFACRIAQGMCGDLADAIELAVGAPHPVEGTPRETAGAKLLAEFSDFEPSDQDLAEFRREEEARDARLDATSTTRMATTYMLGAMDWLTENRDGLVTRADPIVRDAVEIVGWDACLIGAKVHRALDGRDRSQNGEDGCDDHPVQTDWNGSAKVALISLERSEAAWRVIVEATEDGTASALADAVGNLRRVVLDEFPQAMSFIRPGFDEPRR